MTSECAKCNVTFLVQNDHEPPEHGLCWPCSSEEVTKLRAEVELSHKNLKMFRDSLDNAAKQRDVAKDIAESAKLQNDVLRKALEFVHKEDQDETNWFTYEGRRLRYVSMAERGMIQKALKHVTKRKVK